MSKLLILTPAERGAFLGTVRQYATMLWGFTPAARTERRPSGRRYATFEECLPKWTGGIDRTESEAAPGGED